MNLDYAIDRLYETGWTPWGESDVESLPDGRGYPSVQAIQREFARAGLELRLKQNFIFNCCRATWGPAGTDLDSEQERHGTVVGACEREAAVYALAQLRSSSLSSELAV